MQLPVDLSEGPEDSIVTNSKHSATNKLKTEKCLPFQFTLATGSRYVTADVAAPQQERHGGILPLPLHWHYLLMFGGLSSHWLYPLKKQLPFLNEFCGLFEIGYLITFTIGYATRERVGGCSCFFHASTHESQAVVHSCFRSCVLVGDSPATLSMGARFLVRFRGFAFEVSGDLARLLHFSNNCFMSRSAIADFPEGTTQFCTRIVT